MVNEMMTNRDILYVEDNFHNRRIVRKILERKNFNLLEAEDGITGYQMIQDLKPHVVLLDISLPGMDGIEIAQRVKSSNATKHVILIALTASAMAGDRERFLAAGCDDYLSKPFKAFDLIEIVEKHYEEAWAYRADRQTFEKPALVPEPAEIMRVEPEAPAEAEKVEAEPVVEAQEEIPVEEPPADVEAVVEAQEEAPAAEGPVEIEAAAEVQEETLVEEVPVEVEDTAAVKEEIPAAEELIEPEVVAEVQTETPVAEALAEVEAVVETLEEAPAAEEPVETETAAEVQKETPVGDLRKALDTVTETREDALVEETPKEAKTPEGPVNAWLPEAEVLPTEPAQETESFTYIPDTAELVLPSEMESEAQEETLTAQAVQEEPLPAVEKVEAVLEELENAEAGSNNNKPEEEVPSDDSKDEKPNPQDELFNNVIGMINSETIKPLSPNGSSDKH